jgi:hypothetical protein
MGGKGSLNFVIKLIKVRVQGKVAIKEDKEFYSRI